MKEIQGLVYRIKTKSAAWLVEVDEGEDQIAELAKFCAEKAVAGYIITSVTRIFDCSTDTPRIAVLSSPEYKEAYAAARKRKAYREQPESPPESIEELVDRAEYAGWAINDYTDEVHVPQLEFEKYSPAGEDFVFSISGKTITELLEHLQNYIWNFDEEEHIRLNIGGKGAPSIKVLAQDASDILEMLNDLYFAIQRPVPKEAK